MKQALLLILALAVLSPPAFARTFVHPGGLHTKADLERMKTKVAAGEHPWIDGWNALISDPKAQAGYRASPHRHMASRQRAQDDATAAYLNALRWYISGEKANAECAVRILNRWSETVNEVPHGPDQPGLSGIPIGSFALAAEVLRTYAGWSSADQRRFKRMLTKYMYPVCHDFLTRHNGASDTNYWANWDTCNMLGIMAIGVFCDDGAKFDEAVRYFKIGRGTGAIGNVVPFLYPDGLGQWQESGRDQAHVMGGMGLLLEMCQVAWNQGLDLFGYDNNRLLAGAEYTAQYTLWKGVPYTFYTNSSQANQYYISQNYHGRLAASHFELVYNHYVVGRKLKAPHVAMLAKLRRPEPGEIDVFGYGTLTFTRDANASPLPSTPPPVPREVVASGGLERVELKWSPSGAYSAHGYEVCRGVSESGPFESIHSTNNWTTPAYVDMDVEPGRTYFYTVAALNNAGKSAASAPVRAVPADGVPLPESADIIASEGVEFSKAAGRTFRVPASGGDLDGAFVGMKQEGDFELSARLIERRGAVNMMGLEIRGANQPKARSIALTLGEIGGRQTKFRARSGDGRVITRGGNDYTWLPVWYRIQRAGDKFTTYQSSDGIEWFVVAETTMDLPGAVFAGLLASGGGKPEASLATFDHVTLETRLPPAPPAPSGLKVVPLAGGVVRLDWSNPADVDVAGVKVEAAVDGAAFYEIADLGADAIHFENTGIGNPDSIRYRIRAYNRGGYSPYCTAARRGDL